MNLQLPHWQIDIVVEVVVLFFILLIDLKIVNKTFVFTELLVTKFT